MFNSEILEVIIGLIFVFLAFSLLASTINELIFGLISMRGRNLMKSIKYMLSDSKYKDLYREFKNSGEILKLKRNTKWKMPSYLPKSNFSRILLSSLSGNQYDFPSQTDITNGISKLPNGPTKQVLGKLWKEVNEDIEQFRSKLETWFEEVQQRATGWYKRNVQYFLILIGMIISIAFNLDTFNVVTKLSTDSKARKDLVELAISQNQSIAELIKTNNSLELNTDEIDSLYVSNQKIQEIIENQIEGIKSVLGLGWNNENYFKDVREIDKTRIGYILIKFIGFFITSLAISLGANFWFDLLIKFINIRFAGKKPDEKLKITVE